MPSRLHLSGFTTLMAGILCSQTVSIVGTGRSGALARLGRGQVTLLLCRDGGSSSDESTT
jgi:hypothetical protein